MLRTAAISQVNQTDVNIFLVGNPQVTFFKSVYKRHSNFAIESFNVPFQGKKNLSKLNSTLIKCKVPQYGDLLGKIYLKLDVPPMKTNNEQGFKFNKDLGYSMIQNIKLKINGQTVDNIDGEMLYILNTLRNNDERKKMVSRLVNDTSNNDYLHDNMDTISGQNSLGTKTFINKHYNSPIRTDSRSMYIPLQFSFTNYSKTYIPIFLLENKSIEIEILLRPIDAMYTIEKHDKDYWYYEKIPNKSYHDYPSVDISGYTARKEALDNTVDTGLHSPLSYGEQTTYSESSANSPYYLKRYESRIRSIPTDTLDDISEFLYNSDESFSLNPSLELEQIFLTVEEQKNFKNRPNRYLIEQIQKKQNLNIKGGETTTLTIKNHTNLVKELCVTVRRNDNYKRNQWLNFTNYESSDITEEDIVRYQDNWWYTSILESEHSIPLTGANNNIHIIPDRFQEFLFRYGPNGEANNILKAGTVGWPSKISPQYNTYTIKDIDTFRRIWKYRPASDIPKICTDNFSQTWKISPLNNMQMLYDGMSRENTKESDFFNQIQIHKHHTNEVDPGVYMYSYSLEPEKYQPSGYCNMNLFKRIQYKINLNQPEEVDNKLLYAYNILVYSFKYNFVTIDKQTITPMFNLVL